MHPGGVAVAGSAAMSLVFIPEFAFFKELDMNFIKQAIGAFLSDESGASAVEYAVLTAMITGGLVLGLTAFDITALFTNLGTKVAAAAAN